MQLTPRYDVDPVIVLDGTPDAVAEPAIRQRRRLLDTVCALSAEELAHPSRCAGWSNRDVIAHLDIANGFWSFAIRAGQKGEPSRLLTTFDPVTSPALMVQATRGESNNEVLDRFASSTTTLTRLVASLSGDEWTLPAEAPPGHLAISAVVHHALWDSWVHERDILLPLGASPAVELDEIAASLRYAAALGPAFASNDGITNTGTIAVTTTDPEVCFEVDIANQIHVRSSQTPDAPKTATPNLELDGSALDLVEAFSTRLPFPPIPEEKGWMISGLARTFDTSFHPDGRTTADVQCESELR